MARDRDPRRRRWAPRTCCTTSASSRSPPPTPRAWAAPARPSGAPSPWPRRSRRERAAATPTATRARQRPRPALPGQAHHQPRHRARPRPRDRLARGRQARRHRAVAARLLRRQAAARAQGRLPRVGRRPATRTPRSTPCEPLVLGPQFGGHGAAPAELSVLFTNGSADETHIPFPTARRRVPVRGTRSVRLSQLVRNARLADARVDSRSAEVDDGRAADALRARGQHAAAAPVLPVSGRTPGDYSGMP